MIQILFENLIKLNFFIYLIYLIYTALITKHYAIFIYHMQFFNK